MTAGARGHPLWARPQHAGHWLGLVAGPRVMHMQPIDALLGWAGMELLRVQALQCSGRGGPTLGGGLDLHPVAVCTESSGSLWLCRDLLEAVLSIPGQLGSSGLSV